MGARAKRWLKRGGYTLAGVSVIVVGGGASGLAWLGSDSGRGWITDQTNAALSGYGEIAGLGLEGFIPHRVTLDRVELKDPEGNWANLQGVAIDFQPWALLSRKVRVEQVAVQQVDIPRLPSYPADGSEEDAAQTPPSIIPPDLTQLVPVLPVDVAVDKLSVARIVLADQTASALSLEGQAAVDRRFSDVGGAIQIKGAGQDVTPIFSIEGAWQATADQPLDLKMNLAVSEGGRINRLLSNLTGHDVSFAASLTGETKGDGLIIDARMNDAEHGLAVVSGRLTAEPGLDLSVTLTPEPEHWPAEVKTDLSANWRAERRDWPFTVTIESQGMSATATGRLGPDGQMGGQIAGRVPRLPFLGDLPVQWERGQIDLTGSAHLWQGDRRLFGSVDLGRMELEGGVSAETASVEIDITQVGADLPSGSARLELTGLQTPVEGLPQTARAIVEMGGDQGASDLGTARIELGPQQSPQLVTTARLLDQDLNWQANAIINQFALAGYGAEQAGLALTGQIRLPEQGAASVTAGGSVDWSGLTGLPVEVGQLAASGKSAVSVSASADAVSATLTDRAATGLTAASLQADLSGAGTVQSVQAGSVQLDLSKLQAPQVPDLSGRVKLDARLSGSALSGPVTLTATGLTGLPEPASGLLGQQPSLSAQIASLQPDNVLIRNLDLKAEGVTAKGIAGWPRQADLQLALPRLSLVSPRLSGTAQAEVKLQGQVLNVTASSPNLTLDRREVSPANLDLSANLSEEQPAFDLMARLGTDAVIETNAKPLANGQIDLDPIRLRFGQSRLSGDLRLIPDPWRGTGSLDLLSPDLTELQQYLPTGTDIAGAVQGKLALKTSGKQQQVDVTAKATGLRVGEVRLATLELQAAIQDALSQAASTQASLTATEIEAPYAEAADLSATLTGNLSRLEFEADVSKATLGALPVSASLAGQLRDRSRLTLTRGEGRFGAEDWSLNGPAVLAADASRLDITLGQGRIAAALEQAQGRRQASATLEKIDLAPLGPLTRGGAPVRGVLTGSAQLGGSLTAPQGSLQVTLDNPQILNTGEQAGPGLKRLSLSGRLQGGRLSVTGDGQAPAFNAGDGEGEVPVPPFTLSASLPLPANAQGWPQPDMSGRITGQLQAEFQTATLNPLLEELGHRLGGAVRADLSASGTLGAPRLTGRLQPLDLTYDNAQTGSRLTDVTGELVFADGGLTLQDLKGKTGGAGQIALSGSIDRPASGALRSGLSATLDKARLSDSEILRLDLSGQVAARGPVDDMDITGNLTVEEARLNIPRRLPVTIPELEVTDSTDFDEAAPTAQTKGDPRLDVTISAPGKVYLRGRGLDAELRGTLKATGTVSRPQLSGAVSVKRGSLDLLGRSWSLTGGGITFDGPAEQAQLGLTATATRDDFKAIVLITGRLSAPQFKLTSEPELPEDEVLSRLLFGKESSSLSAGEAISLTASLAQLSGVIDEDSPLDSLRDSTGLDRLSLGGGESGGLEAGKYLTDRIYIGVEQGLTQDSSKARIDFEITDELKLEGSVGTANGGAAGLKWQREY
ncbi:MAG: hypothetical protein Alpg2KO_27620 [Alphaproteobacteria bacterium]